MGLFGSIIGGLTSLIGGNKAAKASKRASQLEHDAAMRSIAENARQFDVARADFRPFQELGYSGITHFGDLLGLNGGDAQQTEIDALRASPLYQSLYHNGEQAVLANASATGGLRGGNTVHSLYNLGEDTLSNVIQQQLAGYGSAIGVGSGATGSVANLGANAAALNASIRGEGAASQAQSALLRGGIASQNWNNIGKSLNEALSAILHGGPSPQPALMPSVGQTFAENSALF